MLIALAGLPATGKSSLAACLEKELEAVVLNKDQVRAVLFPPRVLDYSTEQNDICMESIYRATAAILRAFPRQTVILDGRTFLRSAQVRDLFALADLVGEVPRMIECVCADEVARTRLEQAQLRGEHPAGNRTFALYLELKASAEPIQVPHLVLDTGRLSLEECLQRSLVYLRDG